LSMQYVRATRKKIWRVRHDFLFYAAQFHGKRFGMGPKPEKLLGGDGDNENSLKGIRISLYEIILAMA